MQLSDFYPSPNDLVRSEVSVLDYLRRSPYIKERHPQVAVDSATYYSRNKLSRSGFEFHSYFDIWHALMHRNQAAALGKGRPKPNARLTVSTRIELKDRTFSNVTYCLSVCRIESTTPDAQLTILRKFHFDVAVADGSTHRQFQEHPQCHLQYCGEIVPYMTTVGFPATQLDQMHPWLSEPRMFFWPMALALLIDMVFHEFPDQHSAKFRADGYWRGLVRKQEALVLCPFYEKCVEVIKDNKNQNLTLADAFYVS